MANPWDRPTDTSAKSSSASLFIELGLALSTWSNVESLTALLFCHFFSDAKSKHETLLHVEKNASRWYAAHKLYGSMPSTASRLAALRTVASAYYINEADERGYLEKLIKLIENFSPRRNDLAHGVVNGTEDALLETPSFNSKELDSLLKKDGYRYNAAAVRTVRANFEMLSFECLEAINLLFPDHYERDEARTAFPDMRLSEYLQPQKRALKNRSTPQGAGLLSLGLPPPPA
jgi:hypothetical protein